LDEGSVDLIVTSPPYNVAKDYGVENDYKSYPDYLRFLSEVWNCCGKVLKYDGRICVNIGDINKGYFRQPTHSHVISQLEKMGFKYRDVVIWNKSQVFSRTAWGSFCNPSNPYMISPFEYIIIFSKNVLEKHSAKKTDLTKEEFVEWSLGIWKFAPETGISWHPSPFPEELPRRLIKLYSYPGDVILDPFLGSGTTMLVARKLSRSCIGIEINPKYVIKAKERVGFGQQLLGEEVEWRCE
jgi:site-specific DNA-methyltransferase (adenine-specific)